jgi:hypothetical protein
MVTLKNRLNQSMSINLNDGTSKHLLSKEIFSITLEQYQSVEVQNCIRLEWFIVLRMN